MSALLIALSLLSVPAHAEWCSGIITSNGTRIGSRGNTDPPTIDCDDYGRCRRRERRWFVEWMFRLCSATTNSKIANHCDSSRTTRGH